MIDLGTLILYRYLPHLSVRRKNPTSTFILCLSRYQMLGPEMPYSKRVLLNCTILALFNLFIPIIVYSKKCAFISFKSYFIISEATLCFKRLANNYFSRHKSDRKKYLYTLFCMHENISKDKISYVVYMFHRKGMSCSVY